MSTGWRYMAQDLLTKRWLHPDLPLSDVEIEDVDSGVGGITATIAPKHLGLLTPEGDLVLREWVTAIYAEKDDEIRGAGILVRSEQNDDGQAWTLEAPGFATYPHGIPYGGSISRWSADPFQVVRDIWAHLQGYPTGNIGMIVADGVCPKKASPPKPPTRPEQIKGRLKAPRKGPRPKKKKGESTAAYHARVDAWESSYKSRRAAYEREKKTRARAKKNISADQKKWDEKYGQDKPYELSWWEAPDCGSEIESLSTEIPFSYRERHVWNDDHTDVLHHMDLAYPRFGRRRADLRFVVGENVAIIPEVERDGDYYANGIVALGKGEGRKTMRTSTSVNDGRLRRVKAVPFKDVGVLQRLALLASDELKHRRVLDEINEITVFDHPNARLGSWSVGDEILLTVTGPGSVERSLWVRIVSHIVQPERSDTIRMTITNAERRAS